MGRRHGGKGAGRSRLTWPGHNRRYTLDRREIWQFHLPDYLRETACVEGLPLTDAQRAVLNEHTTI